MTYFVSRQMYWPDGNLMVEIVAGGIDLANPDMLVPKFSHLGEGNEFEDPTEAASSALKIRDAWQKITDEHVGIAYGSTMGFSMPFSESSDEDVLAWAEKAFDKLSKCDQCSDILGKKTYSFEAGWGEFVFCSENCAENWYQADLEAQNSVEEND